MKMRTTGQRLLSMLLVLVMVCGLIPSAAAAGETEGNIPAAGQPAPLDSAQGESKPENNQKAGTGPVPTVPDRLDVCINLQCVTDPEHNTSYQGNNQKVSSKGTVELKEDGLYHVMVKLNLEGIMNAVSDCCGPHTVMEENNPQIEYIYDPAAEKWDPKYVADVEMVCTPSDTVIREVVLSGFTAPAIGRHPDFELELPKGAAFHFDVEEPSPAVNGVRWYSDQGALSPDDTFAGPEESAYHMDVLLMPNAGFEFAEDLTVHINGVEGSLTCTPEETGIRITTPDFMAVPNAIITFRVENGTWTDGSVDDKFVTLPLTDGKGTLQENQIPAGMKPDTGCWNGAWDVEPDTAENAVTGDMTFTYRFEKREEATVTFRVEGGTWDGKDSSDKQVKVPLVDGKGRLTADQIPRGMMCKSREYYTGVGKWNFEFQPKKDLMEEVITEDTTYTYRFTAVDFFRVVQDRLHGGGRVEIRLGGAFQLLPVTCISDPSIVITPMEWMDDYARCYAELPDVTGEYVFEAALYESWHHRTVSVTASDEPQVDPPETTYTLNLVSGVPGVEDLPPMTITTTAGNAEFFIPAGPSRPGYQFMGWRTAPDNGGEVVHVSSYFGLSAEEPTRTLYGWWMELKQPASFTVRHMLEKLDGTFEVKETETLYGEIGRVTLATPKYYEGFTSPVVPERYIAADNSTVVDIAYSRNRRELTWDLQGGTPTGTYPQGRVRFGTPITPPVLTKEGCTFDGWEPEPDKTMPDRDVTYTAKWKVPEAKYTVLHMQEMLAAAGTYELLQAEECTGPVGAETAAAARQLHGFTAQPIQQAVIAADGSTQIQIKYDRNVHTLTWDFQKGEAEGVYTQGQVPFGTLIQAPIPTREGYEFDGWDHAIVDTMPDQDLIYVASWTPGTHVHSAVKVEGREPTRGTDGWKPCYACRCGRYFEDEACTREISNLRSWQVGAGKLPKLGYKFLEGMNASWKKNSGKDLTFRADGDLEDFVSILVDGSTVDAKNYTVKSGSTVVTLKAGYLQALKNGSHTLTIHYSDGECETRFQVKAVNPGNPGKGPDSPKTGDESHLLLWSLISMLSLAAAAAVLPRKKRR